MILDDTVKVKWHNRNKKYYVNLGYKFTKIGDEFNVKVSDLSKGSHTNVRVKCDYCGKIIIKEYRIYIKQNGESIIKKDCCINCKVIKTKESNLLTYGVENVFQLEEIKEKQKQTLIDKYGVINISQTNEYKEKFKRTSLERYGVEHPFQNNEIKNKIYETNLKRYGKKNYTQTDDYIKKTIKTNNEKYGCDWAMQNKDIKEKATNTCLEKYGVENPFQSEDIKKKIENTCLKKYGVKRYADTDEFKNRFKETSLTNWGVDHPLKSKNVRNKIYNTNLKKYGCKIPIQNPMIKKKQMETLKELNKVKTSKQQKKIYDMLSHNKYNVEINYTVSNLFLDIALFYEDFKIDIEYDGWYWHKNRQLEDRKRDEFLKTQGWKILRIKSGKIIPDVKHLLYAINKLILTDRTYAEIVLKDWKDNLQGGGLY